MAKVGRFVKEAMVEEIGARLAERPNVFVASFDRLPAPEADRLRQRLQALHAQLLVVKRRLGRRAVEPLLLPGLAELLDGSVGLVFAGEDVLAPAKVITEFQKAHEEWLRVRGAVIDGQLLDQPQVETLATLPPKPVLLAQALSAIESPLAEVIFTVERLIGELAWIVEQAAAKGPAEASAPTPGAQEATDTGTVAGGEPT